MNKSILFVVLLLLITVAVADEQQGPCGKFSLGRMLTHKLRHCAKAAKDVNAPVSAQCCKALDKVSQPCLQAIINSDAFKEVGANPQIALTIPERCHHASTPPPLK